MASDWNMVSNQQSFIDQSIDQWRDCFIAYLKAKSKHFEHLLLCVSLWYVTVMAFKAYITADLNKLTYILLHKVWWEQPSGRWSFLLQLCCKFTKVSVCQKLWKYCEVWQSCCKTITVQCFCLTEWRGYPMVKNVYSFRQNTRTWQTDGRTDEHRTTA